MVGGLLDAIGNYNKRKQRQFAQYNKPSGII